MNLFIDSPANSRIKELVKLRESPRRRKERGMFFVEGKNELQCLLTAGRKINEIYYSLREVDETEEKNEILEFKNAGIQTIKVSPTAFAKASYCSSEYGWLGVVSTWDIGLEKIEFSDGGPVVVLDEVEKPGNLGAILRSVEAFGGTGVILSEPAVDFFNPNVVRSSRGLIGSLPVAKGTKDEVLAWLKNSNRSIWATSSHTTHHLGETSMPAPAAFIFGSEKYGLGEFWKDQDLHWIKIPMKGSASSLNLNVSVACLLYEWNRSREN